MSVKAGEFNKRVTLQSPTGSRDAVGERVTSWTDVATVWAKVEPLTTREQFVAAQAQSAVSQRVTIRYSSAVAGVTGAWRVLFGSRVLVVDGVRNPREAGEVLELLCTEGLKTE